MSRSLFTNGSLGKFAAVIILAALCAPIASAVPSYSRQTGLACSTCHYTPPELTPFGRKFKAEGYSFVTKPTMKEDKKDHNSGLNLLEAFPLSVVFDTSFTSTKAPQPNTQNGNFEFPQAVSLFLAGAWGNHVGSFAQVTYDAQADHFSWDNTDIRAAGTNGKLFDKPLTYGLTFNNNPTVEDLWNSTPAWGFPFVSSNVAPGPTAGALINGGLAQDVAGFGGYGFWNEHVYFEGTIYRSEHIGGSQPNPGVDSSGNPFGINIRGMAPYWRLAYQTIKGNHDFEIGTYGIHVKSTNGGITGVEDSFTDWAADFQYNLTIPKWKNDVFTVRGTYIRENSALHSTPAFFTYHHLNTVQGEAEYHWGTRVSTTAGLFSVTGTADPTLYGQGAVSGNLNGNPETKGYILNLSWWPQQNIGLTAQYTGYTRFNGGSTNYDQAGRSANGNNSIYLMARFVF